MTTIERRIEVPEGVKDPDYQNFEITKGRLAAGIHRSYVGGRWEEMGELQLRFLKDRGLEPRHRFLDVGCGSLRAGRYLVDYLEPGHYFGTDINPHLIETGYLHELDARQRDRLPTTNLRSTDRFDNDFGVAFDMAIAQSVFTHMPLNMMRLCLYRVAKVMKPGGRFYVTFFERDPDFPLDEVQAPESASDSRDLWAERNSFWYYRDDMRWIAERLPWQFTFIGEWDHPRGQLMAEYTRLPD